MLGWNGSIEMGVFAGNEHAHPRSVLSCSSIVQFIAADTCTCCDNAAIPRSVSNDSGGHGNSVSLIPCTCAKFIEVALYQWACIYAWNVLYTGHVYIQLKTDKKKYIL